MLKPPLHPPAPLFLFCPPTLSALCLIGGEMEEAELTSWRFVSSAFSLDLSNTKQHLIPGAPFLLQVSSGGAGLEGSGCWSERPTISLTILFHWPLPSPPRRWSGKCQAPQLLTFLSKFLPLSFLDTFLKLKTFNKTQIGLAKSAFPSLSHRPPQNCNSW